MHGKAWPGLALLGFTTHRDRFPDTMKNTEQNGERRLQPPSWSRGCFGAASIVVSGAQQTLGIVQEGAIVKGEFCGMRRRKEALRQGEKRGQKTKEEGAANSDC